jgi:hypothetical protein
VVDASAEQALTQASRSSDKPLRFDAKQALTSSSNDSPLARRPSQSTAATQSSVC